MDHYQKLKDAGYVGKNLGQGKNDYKDGGNLHGIFLAPKRKLSYTIDKYGTRREK